MSNLYAILAPSQAKQRCRTNEQNDHEEGSIIRREIKPPKRYAKFDLVAYALNVAEDIDGNQESSTYSEVVSCEDLEKWMFTMQEEIESLYKNRTWDLVKLSKDLSYAVNVVSRFMVNPDKKYWKVVRWILRYFRGTTDVYLQFRRNRDEVIGYVNADFAGDLGVV
ncbi:uncharacterized protein [Gossypium hirsutum]|uniref:Uncharacterized protein n=1 Tax=Gossypium hirsutum TaxID=3635 RepID=A0A1U8LDT1_GOSHI|nr:uncharacterized protein LOC107926436 [Gossypium hirsutum]